MKSFTSVLVSIDSVIRRIVNEAAAVVHDDAVCVDFGCDMSFYFIATERIARLRLDPHNPCFSGSFEAQVERHLEERQRHDPFDSDGRFVRVENVRKLQQRLFRIERRRVATRFRRVEKQTSRRHLHARLDHSLGADAKQRRSRDTNQNLYLVR